MKKTIAVILTVVMLIASFPMMLVSAEGNPAAYNGTPDTSWFTAEVEEAQAFTITTAEQLAGFASLVNNGKTFYGFKIKLGADIVINDWTKEELAEYADKINRQSYYSSDYLEYLKNKWAENSGK